MHTYRIDRLADDLAELLVTLRVTGPLTLVGSLDGRHDGVGLPWPPGQQASDRSGESCSRRDRAGNLGSHGLGRLLSSPATACCTTSYPACLARAPMRSFNSSPGRCAALTRHGGYGDTAPKSWSPCPRHHQRHPIDNQGRLPARSKGYHCSQTLSSITAKTTIISGGADKLTPTWHARELADGIPGARHIYPPTAGTRFCMKSRRWSPEPSAPPSPTATRLPGLGASTIPELMTASAASRNAARRRLPHRPLRFGI